MGIKCLANCLLVNLKHNSLPHILAAAVLTATVPIVFGLTSLSAPLSAQPLEMYLPLVGTILMTPTFLPEQNEDILDTIRVRRMSYLGICVMRMMYMCLFAAVFFCCIIGALAAGESVVTPTLFAGGLCSALFLGGLGIFGSAVGGNSVIGYMASLIYFVGNFFLKNRLGVFYLFALSEGTGVSKLWLLGGTLALIAAAFAYLRYIKKIH